MCIKCFFFGVLQNISDEKFEQLFEGLANNTHLETLSLTNVGLTDRTAIKLSDALETNSSLRVLNVETNFITPSVVVRLVKSLLRTKTIEEFRATNQVISKIYIYVYFMLILFRKIIKLYFFNCRGQQFWVIRMKWRLRPSWNKILPCYDWVYILNTTMQDIASPHTCREILTQVSAIIYFPLN